MYLFFNVDWLNGVVRRLCWKMFHLEFGIQCSICIVCCSQLFFNFLPQQFHYDAQIKRMNSHYWDHWFKIPRLNVGACVNIYLRAQSENESVNVWHSNYIIWNAFYQNKRRKIAWTNTLYTSVNCDLSDTCTHILWIFCYRQGKIYYIKSLLNWSATKTCTDGTNGAQVVGIARLYYVWATIHYVHSIISTNYRLAAQCTLFNNVFDKATFD